MRHLTPPLRKTVLLLHTGGSVGLLGAVASFLVLTLVALLDSHVLAVRGAYVSMNAIACWLIVPLASLALLSGLVLALATAWGLFQHWWVLIKLIITALAVTILLLKVRLIGRAAELGMQLAVPPAILRPFGLQLAVHAGGGLLTLIVPLVLSILKPRGLIRGTHEVATRRSTKHT